ncbi:hypothetical protein BKA62DRAFT_436969 [Auriculariales sp. MPI-PUGE-AT-0066]|nr:hypothetical protein BKA62DRAFT_436969 [Auriculariales sp. MPI-PUGE-AT-0066]
MCSTYQMVPTYRSLLANRQVWYQDMPSGIVEPSTAQVVLIWSEKHQYWLLPRGRKDVGESLQQAALREAHEESGYRAELLPLYMPTRAPRTANEQAVTEAIFVSIAPFVDVKAREAGRKNVGGAVVTSWFVAQIPANAVSIPDGRTSDELDFVTHLVPFERAVELLMGQDVSVEAHTELMVIQKAIELWKRTQAITSGELVLDSDHDIGSSRIDRKYWD